jgi:hypothetical protein
MNGTAPLFLLAALILLNLYMISEETDLGGKSLIWFLMCGM